MEQSVEEEEEGAVEVSAEVSQAKELEVEAVRAAEGERLDDALHMLTRAIAIAPAYPSPYNNRAQVCVASERTVATSSYAMCFMEGCPAPYN